MRRNIYKNKKQKKQIRKKRKKETNTSVYHETKVKFFLQGSIYRSNTDGANRTQFAPAAIIGSPSGLAFDWITRIMYYTNPSVKAIEVNIIIS